MLHLTKEFGNGLYSHSVGLTGRECETSNPNIVLENAPLLSLKSFNLSLQSTKTLRSREGKNLTSSLLQICPISCNEDDSFCKGKKDDRTERERK